MLAGWPGSGWASVASSVKGGDNTAQREAGDCLEPPLRPLSGGGPPRGPRSSRLGHLLTPSLTLRSHPDRDPTAGRGEDVAAQGPEAEAARATGAAGATPGGQGGGAAAPAAAAGGEGAEAAGAGAATGGAAAGRAPAAGGGGATPQPAPRAAAGTRGPAARGGAGGARTRRGLAADACGDTLPGSWGLGAEPGPGAEPAGWGRRRVEAGLGTRDLEQSLHLKHVSGMWPVPEAG